MLILLVLEGTSEPISRISDKCYVLSLSFHSHREGSKIDYEKQTELLGLTLLCREKSFLLSVWGSFFKFFFKIFPSFFTICYILHILYIWTEEKNYVSIFFL